MVVCKECNGNEGHCGCSSKLRICPECKKPFKCNIECLSIAEKRQDRTLISIAKGMFTGNKQCWCPDCCKRHGYDKFRLGQPSIWYCKSRFEDGFE